MIRKKYFYPVLINRFKPIAHDEDFIMVDCHTNKEYLLTEDQYKLILELDGTKTFDNILQKYTLYSRSIIMDFVKELETLGAIEFRPQKLKRSFQKRIIKPYLESVLLEVTSNCNLRCPHCYINNSYQNQKKKENDLNLEKILRLIDDLSLINVRDVTITGGEPLLRKDIKKIIDHFMRRNIILRGFFTNGTLITQDFVNYLHSLPYYTSVFISLDGATERINSIIRGKGNFQKILKAIKMLYRANIPISINTSVIRHNLGQLEEMYELLKNLGVSQWRLAIPKPVGGYAMNRSYLEPQWKDVVKIYYKIIDKHLNEVRIIDGEVKAPINLEIEFLFNTQMVNTPINVFRPNSFACYYDKNRCVIKANGDVVPCGFLENFVIGNIKNNSIIDLWLSKKMQKIKNIMVYKITDCQKCKYLKYCGGGCRATALKLSRNFLSKDVSICFLMRFFKKSLISLLKKHGFSLKINKTQKSLLQKHQEAYQNSVKLIKHEIRS